MTTIDDLRRRTDESRARLAGAVVLREQHARIAQASRRRLDASRRLLEQGLPLDEV